jgi:hypothetical protein
MVAKSAFWQLMAAADLPSLYALSVKTGASTGAVFDLFSGRRPVVPTMAARIGAALGVSPEVARLAVEAERDGRSKGTAA